jgi:hypothetical protein
MTHLAAPRHKNCLQCGKLFYRDNKTKVRWAARCFCSPVCATNYRRRAPQDSADHRIFRAQKQNAYRRKIPFRLTFAEWLAWWEAFSPNWRELRGRKRGQYVMSRPGDKGPYALGNIEPRLHETNSAVSSPGRANQGERCGNAKLTDKLVRQIRADGRSNTQIAKALGMHSSHIGRVRRREYWRHVP